MSFSTAERNLCRIFVKTVKLLKKTEEEIHGAEKFERKRTNEVFLVAFP